MSKTGETLGESTRDAVIRKMREEVLSSAAWTAIESEVRSVIRASIGNSPDERAIAAVVALLRGKTDAIGRVAGNVAAHGVSALIDGLAAVAPEHVEPVLAFVRKNLGQRS